MTMAITPPPSAPLLKGYRTFYPGRRIILDFMSHTYSRTAALLHEFARSFEPADIVILHKIYASARETSGAVTGEDLYRAASAMHPFVYYTHEVMDAFDLCTRILRPGDLFITMWRRRQLETRPRPLLALRQQRTCTKTRSRQVNLPTNPRRMSGYLLFYA